MKSHHNLDVNTELDNVNSSKFLATLLSLLWDSALLYWDIPEANFSLAQTDILSPD